MLVVRIPNVYESQSEWIPGRLWRKFQIADIGPFGLFRLRFVAPAHTTGEGGAEGRCRLAQGYLNLKA
jgi:hypothetical protein